MAHTIIDRRGSSLGNPSHNRSLSQIRYFVWHYTATNTSFITNHERFWRDTYGWDRGGYHFYIDRQGNIYQNYDLTQTTWGVANSNSYTAHVSVEAKNGNDYTQAQIDARDWLTRWALPKINRTGHDVRGHWEVYNNTACPGYSTAQMNTFRNQIASGKAVVSGNVVSGGSPAKKIKDEWYGFTLEHDIKVRDKPSTKATHVFTGAKGDSIDYDSVYKGDGHRWLSYVTGGQRVYLPYREENGSEWGRFHEPRNPKPENIKETYTVQAGDTLYSIAQEHGITVDALSKQNDITDPTQLSIGQELSLTKNEKTESKPDKKAADATTHTVEAGDTLYSISQQYATTSDKLAKINGIDDPTQLSIGQVLQLTVEDSDFKPLSKGDTATIGTWASQYETGDDISPWIKGRPLTVGTEDDDIKDVEGTKSNKAYRLYNGDTAIGWVLEQDIVEADKGQRAESIADMKLKQEATETDEVEVVEEKTIEEAKAEEGTTTYTVEEGQFFLNGKKWQITQLDVA